MIVPETDPVMTGMKVGIQMVDIQLMKGGVTTIMRPLPGIETSKVIEHAQEVQHHLRINGVRVLRPAPHGGQHQLGKQKRQMMHLRILIRN